MTDLEYRMFLDLLMCSDPWPVGTERGSDGHEILIEFADKQAHERGFDNWIVAFHEFLTGAALTAALDEGGEEKGNG